MYAAFRDYLRTNDQTKISYWTLQGSTQKYKDSLTSELVGPACESQ